MKLGISIGDDGVDYLINLAKNSDFFFPGVAPLFGSCAFCNIMIVTTALVSRSDIGVTFRHRHWRRQNEQCGCAFNLFLKLQCFQAKETAYTLLP